MVGFSSYDPVVFERLPDEARDNDSFSGVDPNGICWKYSMCMMANTGDNGDPIVIPSSSRYISDTILKKVVSTRSQHLHQVIYWDTGASFQRGNCSQLIQYHHLISGFPVNSLLHLESSSGWNEWEYYSFFPMKWAEFLTYDENLTVSGVIVSTRKVNEWLTEPLLLTMGLNGIPSL